MRTSLKRMKNTHPWGVVGILVVLLVIVTIRHIQLIAVHNRLLSRVGDLEMFPVTADIVVPIITHCMTSLSLSDRINKNCGEAYTTLGTCLTDVERCNISQSKDTLEQLNEEKEELLGEMTEQTRSLKRLVESIKDN